MPFLPCAVESLLRQTESRIRIIAISDGSTDGSEKYLSSVGDIRLKAFSQPREGLVKTLNFGLSLVNTPFVGRMDADDMCDSRRFERQLNYFQSNPDCILVGCSANHIGTKPGKPSWPTKMPTDHNTIIQMMLRRRSAIIHPTIVVRSAAFRSVGSYSEDAWPAEDYELFLRLGLKGRLANLNDILYSIRLHSNTITSSLIKKGQNQYEAVSREYRRIYYHVSHKGKYSPNKCGKLYSFFLRLDVQAVCLYRKGLTRYVNGERIIGVGLLLFSSIISPARSFEYLRKRLRLV